MLGTGAPEQREEVTKLRTGGRSHLAGRKVRDPATGRKVGRQVTLKLEAYAG